MVYKVKIHDAGLLLGLVLYSEPRNSLLTTVNENDFRSGFNLTVTKVQRLKRFFSYVKIDWSII